ncbi:MAG TPA: zinc-ribbon domain-containing protein [Devosia sp.]|nr:zinc-ribbon domain-containing protein [Devosia sp.]
MIITCPHCQTKYQVAYQAIGSAGRKVQCAHCQQAWKQRATEADQYPDAAVQQAIAELTEDGLDEALQSEEKAVAAELEVRTVQNDQGAAGKVDPAIIRRRQRAFFRRQNAMIAGLPFAKLRRMARVGGVLALAGLICGAYVGRVPLVQHYPDLAGAYAAVGLSVNVVGLDLSKATTLRTLRDGKEVLVVTAQITGLNKKPTAVPPVIVTLLDDGGHAVFEWRAAPKIGDLMVGERADFETQLVMPPVDASRVRLSFTGGSGAIAPSSQSNSSADVPAASANR